MAGRQDGQVPIWAVRMFALAAAILFFAVPSADAAVPSSTPDKAVIDLTSWDFQEQGAYTLHTGWTVFRNSLIDPDRFLGHACAISPGSTLHQQASMPDVWGPGLTPSVTSGHGVATYCLELSTAVADRLLALRLGSLRSVSKIYALFDSTEDGKEKSVLLYQNGDPVSAPRAVAYNPATPVIVLPHAVGRMKIVIQVANYVHKQGGMIDMPVIDYYERLDSRHRRDSALPTALVLVLSVVAFATFLVGWFHKDSMRYNIFALLSAAAAFRVLFVSDVVWDYFPTFSLARKYDFEYLSLFLVLPAYYAFIQMLFRNGRLGRFDIAVYAVSAALASFALFGAPFFPPGTVTLLREPFQVCWAIIGIVVAYTVIRSLLFDPRQKKDAAFVLVAAASMSIYEVLSGFGFIAFSMEWSQVLVLFVTLLHVRAFKANFDTVERERDELNKNLVLVNENLEMQAAELKRALVQAEESSRSKDEFLAAMSHELRTPLNAIIGFSEVMGLEPFGPLGDKKYKEYADDISGSGKHLLAIVNDILDLSRVETGNDEMYEEAVALEPLASSVVRLVSSQAAEKGIACTLDCPDDIPDLYADERKIKQILINLVGNAVKFNVPGGSVELKVRCVGGGISFVVSDTGIGIKEADIPNALARFKQVDGNLSRKYEGLGLGLSLVQLLTEQHGGTLQLDSKVGVGTTVTVSLPKERTLAQAREAV